MSFQVFDGFLVRLEDTGLGTCLDSHVAEDHTLADAQCLSALACELHNLVVAAVCADGADDGQDQVSRVNAFRQLSDEVEFYSLRNENPGFSCHHAVEKVGTANAGTEGAESAVRAGVAVSTEDQLARTYIMFHHDLVADAFSLPEINVVFLREVAHLLLGCRCLRAVGRNIVVYNEYHLLCVRDVRMF